jgi:hypothetical protein
MNAYNELLINSGYKDITSRQTADRTDSVKDYQMDEFTIVLDRINIRLLQNSTGLLALPLNDINLCLLIAYTLLNENEREKYLFDDMKNFTKKAADNQNDPLQTEMMSQIFELSLIRQNQTKQTKIDKTDKM